MKQAIIFAASLLTILPASMVHADKVIDWAKITTTNVKEIVAPQNFKEIQDIVKLAACNKQKLSILGAGYSQGGQTAYIDGIVIDMKYLNKISHFDPKNKKITVQTGATWQKIQEYIDPYNLSISVMQSYYNFSVGGSLSVNVHGRDMSYGQIIETVESIKIILANGTLVTASRTENYDIFKAAIGGYGYIGVIVEATLLLTDNYKVARSVQLIPIHEYKKYFDTHVKNNPTIKIYNGNLYPNDFKKVLNIEWRITDKPLTIKERVRALNKFYPVELFALQIMRRVNVSKKLRAHLEPKLFEKNMVCMRNFVFGENTATLAPLVTFPTTHILQEYFIPCDHFERFVDSLRDVTHRYGVNILNCSIRYVPANNESLLSYAPEKDCFAFVLYINILNTHGGKKATAPWTQKLIDSAISLGGSYYLPYQLSATKDQFLSAYKNFNEFMCVKNRYDSQCIFDNELFKKYSN